MDKSNDAADYPQFWKEENEMAMRKVFDAMRACVHPAIVAKQQLLDKVSRMELAAERGLRIHAAFSPIEKGSLLSVEGCHATIKNCQLFRNWINECFGPSTGELTTAINVVIYPGKELSLGKPPEEVAKVIAESLGFYISRD